jgi:methionyl-tRNA formyltransferase
VAQPRSLRLDGKYPQDAEAARAALQDARPDAMVVAAYGLILPHAILDIPRLGCINIHASVLPRWRGAAPIQRAILAGDAATGITLMQMDEGLDTGDILTVDEIPIGEEDTASSLHDRLAELGAKAIVSLLSENPRHRFEGRKQDDALANYAAKLEKAEAAIRWGDDARQIERKIRAFDPFPGAFFLFGDMPVKLWKARIVAGVIGEPGEVLKDVDLLVACGRDGLELEMLQKPGGKRLHVKQFLSGFSIPAGSRLG